MKVKIKTWDQMEKEFGLDEEGCIKCSEWFIPSMEEEMPDDRIITVYEADGEDWYFWRNGCVIWNISNDMIEEIIEE